MSPDHCVCVYVCAGACLCRCVCVYVCLPALNTEYKFIPYTAMSVGVALIRKIVCNSRSSCGRSTAQCGRSYYYFPHAVLVNFPTFSPFSINKTRKCFYSLRSHLTAPHPSPCRCFLSGNALEPQISNNPPSDPLPPAVTVVCICSNPLPPPHSFLVSVS